MARPSDFYEVDPARRTSDEIRLGDGWKGEGGNATYLLFWIEDTGELCALSAHQGDAKVPGSLGPWGTGGSSLTDVRDEDLSIEVLGNVPTEEEARRLVAEVQGSCDTPSIEALRLRLVA